MFCRASLTTLLILAFALTGPGQLGSPVNVGAAQQEPATWQSAMLWYPTLADTGVALAELLNEIDASCRVDVDNVVSTNGHGPEGPVYALAVSWACSGANAAEEPWLSQMIWRPTLEEAGIALAEHVNQIDASCHVDVDPVVSTNGATQDGPVYAYAVAWSCAEGSDLLGSGPAPWLSTSLWRPTLAEAGEGLSEVLNQIEASCRVDVDPVSASSGPASEGPVYAFAIVWACSGPPAADAADADIVATDVAFDRTEITIAANREVTLTIANNGDAVHNFSIDEFDLSVDIAPGESYALTIEALPGEYEFYCAVPGHRDAGMTGTLIVE